jgi:hypothetical protein
MKLKENSLFDSDIVEITNEPKEVRNFVKVIEVMIPRPLITTLYYTIDNFDANRFVPGCRVIVPLGRGGD